MGLKKYLIFFFLSISLPLTLSAQLHCGLVEFVPNTSVNNMITFDSTTKYQGGITIISAARLKIRVANQTIPDPLCSWNLTMSIDNNAGAGTPNTEWEELALYGNGLGNNPLINSLEIRVRNACATSPTDGVFQTFSTTTDIIDLIAALLPVTPAGSCTTNVNGPGNFISNFDEFQFTIDIRVKPGFAYNPGIFQLSIRFHLEENP